MFTLNNLAVLALAGTTLAAPQWSGGWSNWQGGGSHNEGDMSTSTVWDIATATVTTTGEAPTATWAPPTSTPVEAATTPSASAAAFYTSWSSAASAASSAAGSWASSAASGAMPTTGASYMSVVDYWRSAGGLSALTEDSTLQANALKTVTDSDGQMIHELNPGSMAQVLAPGNEDNFESVYVGGWLCEIPSLPGLNGICTTAAQGWDHSDGETGHADILTSTSYSKIGCALYAGIWACDLA